MMYVVGHGINSVAAFTEESLAKEYAKSLTPIEINGTKVKAEILELNADEYTIDNSSELYPNGVLHGTKHYIQCEVLG